MYIGKQKTVTENRLTWVLNLDSRVRLRVGFVNYLRAHLLRQNLAQRAMKRRQSHILYIKTNVGVKLAHWSGKCFVTS